MTVTLPDLVSAARARVGALRGRRDELERAAMDAPVPPRWPGHFGGGALGIVAEVKRRSPSAGDIAPRLDAVVHAAAYVEGGAHAVSVLTEPDHFAGSLEDLRAVARAVPVPVLRKDFIIDRLQLLEARAAGAAAVLLIVRALEGSALADLAQEARRLQLGTLVEVHGMEELEGALAVTPDAVGVNARDLKTFVLSPDTVAPVLQAVPTDVIAIAESGIRVRADVERLAGWGADGILVGTSVASAPNPAAAVRALVGVARGRWRKGAV